MKKTEIVRMRITPEDKSLLRDEAIMMNSTISEYMEFKIFCKEIPPERETAICVLKAYAKQKKADYDLSGCDANKLLDAMLYWIEKL